jgi:hypothetical protein
LTEPPSLPKWGHFHHAVIHQHSFRNPVVYFDAQGGSERRIYLECRRTLTDQPAIALKTAPSLPMSLVLGTAHHGRQSTIGNVIAGTAITIGKGKT